MSSMRRLYYDLFLRSTTSSSDCIPGYGRLASEIHRGEGKSIGRRKALDLCTGTGSVAAELAKRVRENGFVVGLDFSQGMLEKAKRKALSLHLNQLHLVQANASQLPFQNASFHGVTCSHAFYELKEEERTRAIEEVARILKKNGAFCLMEHAKPEKRIPRYLFYVRLFFLGSKDARTFLVDDKSILEKVSKYKKRNEPDGRSKLIYGEKGE
jgi:ubiquinone/menaquinone biosynthesis C-methylase UbiE